MSLDCYSKVNLLPDNSGWVTSLENDALKDILFGLGVDCIFLINTLLLRIVPHIEYWETSWLSIIIMAILL